MGYIVALLDKYVLKDLKIVGLVLNHSRSEAPGFTTIDPEIEETWSCAEKFQDCNRVTVEGIM